MSQPATKKYPAAFKERARSGGAAPPHGHQAAARLPRRAWIVGPGSPGPALLPAGRRLTPRPRAPRGVDTRRTTACRPALGEPRPAWGGTPWFGATPASAGEGAQRRAQHTAAWRDALAGRGTLLAFAVSSAVFLPAPQAPNAGRSALYTSWGQSSGFRSSCYTALQWLWRGAYR